MKLLTLARDLRRRKARGREGLFAAEGVRAVEELLKSPVAIRGVLVAPQLSDAPRGAALLDSLRKHGGELAEVSALEFASAAETESPQGVLAVAEIPSWTFNELPLASRWRMVLLDGVQDPGNVGTIVRTAAALGALAVLAMPGTVDLWNAKVVRSTMGASFHMPAFACTWEALDTFRSGVALTMWGADAGGRTLDTLDIPDRLIIAVGNEGSGLSTNARSRVDALASLPISANVESLNVAVATGILLYQVRS